MSNVLCFIILVSILVCHVQTKLTIDVCKQTPEAVDCLMDYGLGQRWPHTQRYVFDWKTKKCSMILWSDYCPIIPNPPTKNNFMTDEECMSACGGLNWDNI